MNRQSVDPDEPTSYLPLTPAVFHILLSLAAGERHGYAMIVDIRERTAGDLRLRTGTLYTAIRRLLQQGLIAEVDTGDERRRTYRLLPRGRAVAEAEAARLRRAVDLAEEHRLLPASD